MAKKNIKSTHETSTDPGAPRRRSPAPRKKADAPRTGPAPAAPPVGIAGVSGIEPISTAPDSGASAGEGGNGGTRRPPTHAEIAEAAYFRHIARGGHSDQFKDWIEAERELKAGRR